MLICVLFAALPASSPRFMTGDNWRLIAVQTVILGMVALGATLVMIAGGIDLSVGSAVALITVGIVQFHRQLGWPLPVALVGGVVLGGACGVLNGALITGLRVVPFIITLGTLKVFRGLAKWWAGNLSIYAFDRSRPEPDWLKRTLSVNLRPPGWLADSAGDPIRSVLAELTRVAPGVWSLLGLSVLVALLLRYALLGRYLYAVGSNEATARLCGVRVPRVKLAVYGLAGLLTGVAGLMQFAYFHGTGDPTSGEGLELKAIASVVIGGGSLSGGEGTVLGTLVGCLIIQVLENGCTHAGIPNAIQDILIGVIIIVAVAIDQIRRNPKGPARLLRAIAERLGGRPSTLGGEDRSMNVAQRTNGVLAGLILAVLGVQAMADDKGEGRRSITVSGMGKVSATPDVAEVTIGVVSQAESARDALAANTEAMTAVQALLKDRGVAEKDVQTVSISIQPRYNQPQPPRPGQAVAEFVPRIVGYEVNNAVRITARDIKKLGAILDAVVQSGANRIDGIGFRIDEPEKLEDLARKAAVGDARRKAAQLAGELGVVVGLPIRVSEGGSMPMPQPMFRGRAMAMEAMAAPVPVAAGELDVVVSVTVEFELLPPQ